MATPVLNQQRVLVGPETVSPEIARVRDFLDRTLPSGWEIYVQPHLNGLRPDIVLLNPNVGITLVGVSPLTESEATADLDAGKPNLLLHRLKYMKERVLEFGIAELVLEHVSTKKTYGVVSVAIAAPNLTEATAKSVFLAPGVGNITGNDVRYCQVAGADELHGDDPRVLVFKAKAKHRSS